MSNSGLSYGLNIKKKAPTGSRPLPGKRKAIFDEPDSDSDDNSNAEAVEEIGELGGLSTTSKPFSSKGPAPKLKGVKPTGKLGAKNAPISMYGDLASSFTSKKHADKAEELDANIYDYDAVYDSLKPTKKVTAEDKERKPKYMTNLIAAAEVRQRDARIAEEKKLAREREAEGDEFADKEKFVTSAYKKQQEENRRLEAEEKRREEQEAKKNKGTGMTSFYKNMLEKGEQKHAEVVKAVEDRIQAGPGEGAEEEEQQKTEADIAREISEKTGESIAINDEGQVVDKRQLLKGGLNIAAKAQTAAPASASRPGVPLSDRSRGAVGVGGGKQAMRERQTRMMEAQLEQATKRALEQEEEDKEALERASKSRKTEGDIMSAKERYLARKREAEEAKKKAAA